MPILQLKVADPRHPIHDAYLLQLDRVGKEMDDPQGMLRDDERPYRVGAARRLLRRLSDATISGGKASADAVKQTAPERRLLSERILTDLKENRSARTPYTDIFFLSHGWLTDLEGATTNYTDWIEQMHTDIPPNLLTSGFKPLVIALHWPSKPRPFRQHKAATPVPYALVVTDDDGPARARIRGTDPGSGFENFMFSLMPWLSFYRMKARSAVVGRRGGARLLASFQKAAGPDARFQLMGHSFGAKLLAETLADRSGHGVDKVNSAFLVEAAMSTWGFYGYPRTKNPYGDPPGDDGIVLANGTRMVTGPAIAITSKWDYALVRVFPGAQLLELALTRLVTFHWFPLIPKLQLDGQPPRLAALGTWAFAGVVPVDSDHVDAVPAGQKVTKAYGFLPGHTYHLVADDVMTATQTVDGVTTHLGELVGGHSNFVHPEIANAFWQAVQCHDVATASLPPTSTAIPTTSAAPPLAPGADVRTPPGAEE